MTKSRAVQGGVMKRSRLSVVSVALVMTIVLIAGCGPSAVRETTIAVLSSSAPSSITSTTESLLEKYRAQLVSPADLADQTLARIVAGLLGRGIPVISATVTSSSPLKISLTVPDAQEGGGPVLALPQAKREATAEWVREGKPSEIEVKIEETSGRVVSGASIPLPAGFNITPEVVRPATVDLATAKRLLEESIGPLVSAPLELLTLDLTEDVLNARLLHIRVLVPDFPHQIEAYEAANAAIGGVAGRLTQGAGIAVGVVWLDAVNEQGQLWTARWGDVQLNSEAGQNGLAKDYFPSDWPRPATTSATGQGVSSSSTD